MTHSLIVDLEKRVTLASTREVVCGIVICGGIVLVGWILWVCEKEVSGAVEDVAPELEGSDVDGSLARASETLRRRGTVSTRRMRWDGGCEGCR